MNAQDVKLAANYFDLDIAGQNAFEPVDSCPWRTSVIAKPEAARDAVDALAKDIYGRLFDWLVGRVNKAIDGEKEEYWRFGHIWL